MEENKPIAILLGRKEFAQLSAGNSVEIFTADGRLAAQVFSTLLLEEKPKVDVYEKGAFGVTEEEAKDKWCPAIVAADGSFGKCFASRCMWWRWLSSAIPSKGFCGAAGPQR